MQVRVGTSGYAYNEWKGGFDSARITPADMLSHHGKQLRTVEINNTVYRMPKREVIRRWKEQVPGALRFVLKTSGRITHEQRLEDVGDEIGYLAHASEELGETRGPTLFQLPPDLRKDLDRLQQFLNELPAGWSGAIELRHESWHEEDGAGTEMAGAHARRFETDER